HRLHEDLALAALDVAEAHHAVHLGDRRRILRTTGLEELGDSRQAAGDVARLVSLAADLRQRRARGDLPSILDRELRADGDHEVAHALVAAPLVAPDL